MLLRAMANMVKDSADAKLNMAFFVALYLACGIAFQFKYHWGAIWYWIIAGAAIFALFLGLFSDSSRESSTRFEEWRKEQLLARWKCPAGGLHQLVEEGAEMIYRSEGILDSVTFGIKLHCAKCHQLLSIW